MKKKSKSKSKWQAVLPAGVRPGDLSLAQLHDAKRVHEFLTEDIRAPEEIAYYIRSFRFLLFFGVACIHENKYPPLTACWNDLDERFMQDPYFDDELFVQSWILFDFPFGPEGQTALDHFQTFLSGGDTGAQFERFIHAARRSRLGLHQDVMHTKQHAKVRELFTGDINELFPSAHYERGEILLVRLMPYRQGAFMFGHPKGFPRDARAMIEGMVLDKMFLLRENLEHGLSERTRYERFMKVAGPYWMSCVTPNEDAPVLAPDHYRGYFDANHRG
jgi:hypothetical protein